MIIANFREYVTVLRDVYSHDVMGEIGAYYQSLMRSGTDLKRQKADIQNKINACRQQIERQTQLIRTAGNKKTAGLRLAEIKRQKQQLVNNLKTLQNGDHFNVLSNEAKVGVCSGFLLQKYLTRELLKHNPLNFAKDAKGNLIIDCERLKDSEIFQQAVHLRDFVAAYIVKYPDKVKTPGHFKTLLNGVEDWNGLLNYADDFFNRLNDGASMEEGPLKASRCGVEVIKIFPEQKLQLVRLHTAEALDYETEKMNHCVGKGGYDNAVSNGKIAIYSLRDYSVGGEWIPHATIEYKDGKISQVKGYKNGEIESQYYPQIRQGIFAIYGTDDVSELYREKKIADLQNWGYVIDVKGVVRDYYNLNEEVELRSIDLFKVTKEKAALITVDTVNINGEWTTETTEKVKRFKKVKHFNLAKMSGGLLEARRYFAENFPHFSSKDIVSAVESYAHLYKLGFATRYQGPGLHISFGSNENLWVDLLNLKQPEKISSLTYDKKLVDLIKPELLSVHALTVKGSVEPDVVKGISRFRSVSNILFKNADFSACNKLDLSPINNFDNETFSDKETSFSGEEADMVAENGGPIMTIAKFVGGRMIRFSGCTHMPDMADIRFPDAICHIVADAENDQTPISKACFETYQNLETLQLNNYDLQKTEVFTLPENIRYLGFGSCAFGTCANLDLTIFPQLETVRLVGSYLSQTDKIVFPPALKKCAVQNVVFKPGMTLDYRQCDNLEEISFFNFDKTVIACGRILPSESLKELSICYGVFSELEEIDLSVCRRLGKLSLKEACFPKLKKMIVPACEMEEDKCQMAAGSQTVILPENIKETPRQMPQTVYAR